MDASSYGRMVARTSLVSKLDTRDQAATIKFAGNDAEFAKAFMRFVRVGMIQLPSARGPDDGCAGVPVKA